MRWTWPTIMLFILALPGLGNSQTADFNYSTTSGLYCSPQNVVFTQNCSPGAEAFIWVFGNGATGSSGTETIMYTNPGTYNVTLTAIYPGGGVSVTKTVVINPTPTVSISADRDYICQPGIITFTAPGSSFITSYEWNFGDGSPLTTTGSNTTGHSFAAYGNYTVTVRGITAAGCFATASMPVQVTRFPIVNPTVTPTNGCIPVNASFSASVTVPTGDVASNYAWNFGDGSPVANTPTGNTNHIYTIVTPINTATLTVTTAQGCTNQYTFPQYAYGTPPFNTNAVTADGRSTYCASETITFNGTAVNANMYVWDFGDGNSQITTGTSISYRYRTLGSKRVTLTPFFNGCEGTKDFIDLVIVGVVADYTYSNAVCSAKDVFSYNNLSLGNISSFRWTFSDVPGSPDVTNMNPVHDFPAVGSFSTNLFVYDAVTGCSDSLITNQYTAQPSFTVSTTAICKDSVITYSVLNSYPVVSGYTHEFHVNGAVVNTGVITSIAYKPLVHGTFTDFVVISGPTDGTCDDTLYLPRPTFVRGPVLDFSLPLSDCFKGNSFPITNNTAPFFAGENITRWAWDFGDNTTSNLQNPPPHTFPATANYWVKLTATDINNCGQKDSILITINPTPQLAVFPKSDTLCAGTSLNLYAYTADTLLWTTNYNIDCVTCDTAVANPMITTAYAAQATNRFGCVNTDTSFIRVFAPFTLQVNPSDTSICPGGRVQYQSNVSGIFTWSPANFLNSPGIASPLSRPDTSITYTIIARDSANCFADTATASIRVFASPLVNAGPDQVITFNNPFTISPVYSPDVVSYRWTPLVNNLSCPTCPIVTGVAAASALYRIEVINGNSCRASDDVRIIVACNQANLNLPSGFTPNNNGRNDLFYPMTRGYRTINKFIVFDRSGNKVFERYNFQPNSPALGWNGKLQDGQVSGTAVYVWLVEATCDAGETVQSKGTVTVIR